MEIYLERGSGYTCTLTTPGGQSISTTAPTGDDLANDVELDSDYGHMSVSWGKRPDDNEDVIFVEMNDDRYGSGTMLKSGEWKIEMSGGSGEWDAYVAYENRGDSKQNPPYFLDFDNTRMMGEPTNVKDVVTVGAINSNKIMWLSGYNGSYDNHIPLLFTTGAGKSAYYSSPGPSRTYFKDGSTGTTKDGPDIYAPGTLIATARPAACAITMTYRNNNYNVNNDEYMMQLEGTSFSAPHVTGAIALLLEINPNFTVDEIKNILTGKTALKSATSEVAVLNIFDAVETASDLTSDFYIIKGTSSSNLSKGELATFNARNKSTVAADSYNWEINLYYINENKEQETYTIKTGSSTGTQWTPTIPSTTLPQYNWVIDENGNIQGTVSAEAIYRGTTTMGDTEYITLNNEPCAPVLAIRNTDKEAINILFSSRGTELYRVYYGSAPYDLASQGSGADQGASPITITAEEYNELTLSGLNLNDYIWVTALNDEGTSEASEFIQFRKYTPIPYYTSMLTAMEDSWTLAPNITGEYHTPERTYCPGGPMMILNAGSSTYEESYLDFNLNLAGEKNIVLSYSYIKTAGTYHDEDGIWLSDNGGQTFIKVYDIDVPTETPNWQYLALHSSPTIDISKLAEEHGLELTKNFVIRFNIYDNVSGSQNGFVLDNVSIKRGATSADISDATIQYCERLDQQYRQSTNYGDYSLIQTMEWTYTNEYKHRSLINFDLSNVEPGAIIDQSDLYLYGAGTHDNSPSNASYLSRITEPWDEYEVTWNTQPQYVTTDQVLLPISSTADQDYVADMTDIIQYQVDNPEEAYGVMLRLQNEVKWTKMAFGSSDNADESLQPRLNLNYHLNLHTLAIEPDKDALLRTCANPIYADMENTNYGSSTLFGALEWTNGGSSYPMKYRSLIDFNFDSLPQGANIVSAKLSLYGTGSHASNDIMGSSTYKDNSCLLYLVKTPWEEDVVTWN